MAAFNSSYPCSHLTRFDTLLLDSLIPCVCVFVCLCVCVCVFVCVVCVDSEPVVKQSVARAPKCRNAAEEEYLAKLHAIRRRNYLEKKRIMEKVSAKEVPPNPSFSPERAVNRQQERGQEELDARRKKIAALKVCTSSCVTLCVRKLWWSTPDHISQHNIDQIGNIIECLCQ